MASIRTTALCLLEHDGRLLLQEFTNHHTGKPYFRPFGGGVEFGETAAAAMRREMLEELGAEITALELLGVIEDMHDLGEGRKHYVVFLYRAQLLDDELTSQDEFRMTDNQTEHRAVWLSLASLRAGEVVLHPPELQARLDEFFPPQIVAVV